MKDATAGRWEWLDLLLILFGPLTHLLFLASAWTWGANWINGVVWVIIRWGVALLQLVGVGLTVALLIWQRNSTNPPSRQREFSTTFLIVTVAVSILVPWGFATDWLRTEGRHSLEASLPSQTLAEECLALTEVYGPQLPEAQGVIELAPEAYPPTIAKLSPAAVWVDGDGVHIEQSRFFIPYGYRFVEEPESREWWLVWRSEGQSEKVVAIKFPTRPLGEGD